MGESGNWGQEAGLAGEAAWGCLRGGTLPPTPPPPAFLVSLAEASVSSVPAEWAVDRCALSPSPHSGQDLRQPPLSVHGGGGVHTINLRTRSETSSGSLFGPEGTSSPGLKLHLQKNHFPLNSPQTF